MYTYNICHINELLDEFITCTRYDCIKYTSYFITN